MKGRAVVLLSWKVQEKIMNFTSALLWQKKLWLNCVTELLGCTACALL
jgi:hypothetical protein